MTKYLEGRIFTRIIQLADVHIHRTTRHAEYVEIMTDFTEKVQQLEDEGGCGIAVICGDVFHSKTNLTPDAIQILKDFLRNLPVPVIVIAGNHDVNMSNKDKLDALSPTIDDVENAIYLRDSGNYKVGNLWFGVYSVIDSQTPDLQELKNKKGMKIALHHGTVNGAVTATGQILTDKKNRSREEFKGWDLVLLGDIHQCQSLEGNRAKGTMRYSGSFIQQNFGEDGFHGALVWNLETPGVSKIHTDDVYGWCKMYAMNGKLQSYDMTEVPKKVHIKLVVENTKMCEIDLIEAELKSRHHVVSFIPEISMTASASANKKFHRDLQKFKNLEPSQLKQYFLGLKIPKAVISKVLKLHERHRKDLMDTETESDHHRFKPLRMCFTNMFVYRGDWEVTFPDGVVGLFGDNGVGKSSIIDIMIFALYKKTLRGKQQHEIVTHGEKQCKVFIEFESGGTVYRIYRESGIKNKTRATKIDKELRAGMRFWQVNSDGTLIDLTEGALNDTYNAVAAVIGKYEVLSDIGAMIQGNNKYFADQEKKERSERLNSILNLDIFDKLLKQMKPESIECKRNLDAIQKKLEDESKSFSKEALRAIKRELNSVRTILERKRQLEKSLAGQDISDIRAVRDELSGRNVEKVYAETEGHVTELQHLIGNLPKGHPDMKLTADLEAEYNYAVELEARVFAERGESATRRAELLSARNKYPPKSELHRDAVRLEELNDEIGHFTFDIQLAQQAAEDLKKHEYDPNCKFCMKNTLVERAREQLKQLPYLQKRLKSLMKEHKSVENADEMYRTINEIDRQLSLLPENNDVSYDVIATKEWQNRGLTMSSSVLKSRLDNERRTLQGQIERQRAEKHLAELRDRQKRLKPLLNCNFEEISSLEESIQNLASRERVLAESLGSAKERAKSLKKLLVDVAQCDADYEAYKAYENALGRDGIQKTLRNRMIRDLETQMNAIIGSLAPFNIKIEEETSMIRFVRDARKNDAEMLAHMGSGSEKLLIELALRTVMATRAKHSINMLILDESLSFLDSNKREVLNGLFAVLNKYFKTVLVISHDVNVKEHVQKLLEVKKGANWDEIRDNMPLDR